MALNFFTDIDDDRVRSAFGEEKYRRLVALKDRYDLDNVFHRNQNVRPSMAASDLVEPHPGSDDHRLPLVAIAGTDRGFRTPTARSGNAFTNSLISVDDHRVTATATSG